MNDERLRDWPACWEVMECTDDVMAACPAHPEYGRECWKITGTRCGQGENVMKDVSEKILHCRNECRFYKEYIKDKYP